MPDHKQQRIIPTEEEYGNFKHMLEYFVAHMEYVVNKDKAPNGREDQREAIQEPVSTCSKYSFRQIREIEMEMWTANSPKDGYLKPKLPILNVKAEWEDEHISKLKLQTYPGNKVLVEPIPLKDFSLNDNEPPNDTVKFFLNSFVNIDCNFQEEIDCNSQKKITAIQEHLKTYTDILEKNYNLILTGAPGTGKTYLAKQIACQMIFGKVYSPEEIEKDKTLKSQFDNQCDFVQFHPSYDYTDFVEGLRPTPPGKDKNIGFKLEDGALKKFCKKAIETEAIKDNFEEAPKTCNKNDRPFVFIIDEINRGDIAKIFGELFFALDPGYRGEKGRVKTQYTNLINENDIFKSGFYIPENVYIIGTMNDIDRNVGSMDFAIRRRFTWMEIKPEDNLGMWDDPEYGIAEYKDKAKTCIKAINEAISDIPELGKAYQLGASYFLKLREYEGDFNKLWEYHIQPLLNEYLRGLPNAETEMKELIRVWNSVQSPAGQPEAEQIEGNAQA